MLDDGQIGIIYGLPRSGTSMLMKMLTAGGLEPLIDNVRQATTTIQGAITNSNG